MSEISRISSFNEAEIVTDNKNNNNNKSDDDFLYSLIDEFLYGHSNHSPDSKGSSWNDYEIYIEHGELSLGDASNSSDDSGNESITAINDETKNEEEEYKKIVRQKREEEKQEQTQVEMSFVREIFGLDLENDDGTEKSDRFKIFEAPEITYCCAAVPTPSESQNEIYTYSDAPWVLGKEKNPIILN